MKLVYIIAFLAATLLAAAYAQREPADHQPRERRGRIVQSRRRADVVTKAIMAPRNQEMDRVSRRGQPTAPWRRSSSTTSTPSSSR
jgi:hypothetical protein